MQKNLLVITGDDAQVFIDKIAAHAEGNGNGGQRQTSERGNVLAIHSVLSALRRVIEEVKQTQEQDRLEHRRHVQMMQSNISRIAIQPIARP